MEMIEAGGRKEKGVGGGGFTVAYSAGDFPPPRGNGNGIPPRHRLSAESTCESTCKSTFLFGSCWGRGRG